MIVTPCRLGTGIQSSPTRRDHDVLQEHAVIEPGSSRQPPVDGKDHPHRRVKELEVPPVLRLHLRGLATGDPQQTIQAPPNIAPPRQIGLEKRIRIVRDFLYMALFPGVE